MLTRLVGPCAPAPRVRLGVDRGRYSMPASTRLVATASALHSTAHASLNRQSAFSAGCDAQPKRSSPSIAVDCRTEDGKVAKPVLIASHRLHRLCRPSPARFPELGP